MLPTLANPAGLWALLGVPAILGVHFLQQRSRPVVTSTWFLIEPLSPRSVGGRTWERLLPSRQLWLQLLAVLVATWLAIEPRWTFPESAQTVVVVLDTSAGMEAFRPAAVAAAAREFAAAAGLAQRTTWVLMSSDPREPVLYRGTARADAEAALARWRPELGAHDLAPALRLAHGLAGEAGRTLLVTDTKTKVPPGQRAVGVGRPIENVGFAGATIVGRGTVATWRAFVQNHSAVSQRRTWWIETAAGRTVPKTLELPPGALVEIDGEFPGGTDQCTVVLEPDEFAADDRLPLVRPQARALSVAVVGDDAAADFVRKVSGTIDGLSLRDPAVATLLLARRSETELLTETHPGIFWPAPDARQTIPLVAAPITAERQPLVDGLNWQGWIGTGPFEYASHAGDTPLLWQEGMTLAFLHTTSRGALQLRLALDWSRSNAARLPAMALLLRRFLEQRRDEQAGPFTANFDALAPLPFADTPENASRPGTLTFEPAEGGPAQTRPLTAVERRAMHAPGRAGFFTLKRGADIVVRGAVQFADAREGDFREAATFFSDQPGERRLALERLTRPDPLATIWLAALMGLVVGSWWIGWGGRRRA